MRMNKSNINGRGSQRKVNPAWFTGKVWMKDMSTKMESTGQDIYHVHFENGARTKLHRHNGSQVLIATAGKGNLILFQQINNDRTFGIKKTKTLGLRPGDAVFIPAGILHTHGSVDTSIEFAHIAINNIPCNSSAYTTEWYETDGAAKVLKMI